MGAARMDGADAANLAFDGGSRVNAFLIAGELGPGGFVSGDGDVDIAAARDILMPRVRAVRRLNQRPVRVRGRWTWIDADADAGAHIRLVEAPDGVDGLCARLVVTPLDRGRPLWELLLVPRAAEGRAGLVVRVHHAVADGRAALGILGALADAGGAPDVGGAPSAPRAPDAGHRRPALADIVQEWAGYLRSPRLGPTVLLGAVGEHRGVRVVHGRLATAKDAAAAAGGTLNDLVLAVVAGAVEATLRTLGEEPPTVLPMSVPVAVPRRGGAGNALANVIVGVPLGVPSVERIAEVHARVATLIGDARRRGDAGGARSPFAMRLVMLYARRQRRLAVVTSDVRGPAAPASFGGSPLLRAGGVGPLGGDVRVSVVVVSYAGGLTWAVHTDEEAVPAGILADAVRAELAALGA